MYEYVGFHIFARPIPLHQKRPDDECHPLRSYTARGAQDLGVSQHAMAEARRQVLGFLPQEHSQGGVRLGAAIGRTQNRSSPPWARPTCVPNLHMALGFLVLSWRYAMDGV